MASEHISPASLPGEGGCEVSSRCTRISSISQVSLVFFIALVNVLVLSCTAMQRSYLSEEMCLIGFVVILVGDFVGGVAWLMGWLERAPRSFPAPSVKNSKLLVALVPVVFWIPIFGMIVTCAAIYRAYWLILPNWISLLLSVCFFASATLNISPWGMHQSSPPMIPRCWDLDGECLVRGGWAYCWAFHSPRSLELAAVLNGPLLPCSVPCSCCSSATPLLQPRRGLSDLLQLPMAGSRSCPIWPRDFRRKDTPLFLSRSGRITPVTSAGSWEAFFDGLGVVDADQDGGCGRHAVSNPAEGARKAAAAAGGDMPHYRRI